MRSVFNAIARVLAVIHAVAAVELSNVDDTDAVKSAASTIAERMVSYYHGNEPGLIPGELGDPYYWWECGAMFNSLINYWYYTGDTTYNKLVKDGMLFQVGPDNDYMPPNQTKAEGNDDQYFWGCAAMSAAEYNFDNPSADEPGWLALAQGVFNSQVARWDDKQCAGGLRWQIFTWNNGFDYKNTASNGGLFNLGARLGAYTGDQEYLDWAEKLWNWLELVGLIGDDLTIYDGTTITDNCTSLDHTLWTYTAGMMLNGAAVMWNQTESPEWRQRTEGIWKSITRNFFTGHDNRVMRELCEPSMNCNTDQQSFKAYLARFMASSAKVAPWLYDTVRPYIEASAVAAAAQCSGGDDGVTCGLRWTDNSTWDGSHGVGQQMAALEIVQALLIDVSSAPVTADNGGTSAGNPDAGKVGNDEPDPLPPIATSDQAGAGILTVLACLGTVGGSYWLLSGP